MTPPNNARRDVEAEWLPRGCQAWIVEQTRRRGCRQRTELGQRDVPAEAHGGQHDMRESRWIATAGPD